MKVLDAYTRYKILPFLQLHQLRVAAVAKSVVDHFDGALDERSVTIACLFHDMGNIIKVDFDRFPDSFEPEGVAYWQKVQEDFLRRFGPDEHHATIAIGHELHLPLQAITYIDGVGFSKMERTRDSHSYEQKIVEYADLRVAPLGIVSMHARHEETRIRYEARRTDIPRDDAKYRELVSASEEIERQIFSRCSIKPEDISDDSVRPIIEDLRGFQVV